LGKEKELILGDRIINFGPAYAQLALIYIKCLIFIDGVGLKRIKLFEIKWL
jgi:hypothetical protein